MVKIYEKNANNLIEEVAEKLKGVDAIQPPDWAAFVKTGMHKQRSPINKDWWYVRAASILRWVAIRGPVGVSKLRTKYGGKKNRGVKPDKFFKSSGNIIRKILQQLESAGLIVKKDDGIHKGRIITAKGRSFLDGTTIKEQPKKETKESDKKEAAPVKEAAPEEVKEEKKEAPAKEEKAEAVEETKEKVEETTKQPEKENVPEEPKKEE